MTDEKSFADLDHATADDSPHAHQSPDHRPARSGRKTT